MSPSLLTVENVMDFLKAGDQFCIDSIRNTFIDYSLTHPFSYQFIYHSPIHL